MTPAWLEDILRASASPRDAYGRLLFHGTIEPFDGPIVASDWEHLRWFATSPDVAQSYCPESGSEVLMSFPGYRLDDHFIPNHHHSRQLFETMGHSVAAMDATCDHTGRMTSYMILDGHPSERVARAFLEDMGYVFENESAWIKVRLRADRSDEFMPADWRTPGRLYIASRPDPLVLHDMAGTMDGGLTGRQWMETDVFEEISRSGNHDGVVISDIHQTKSMGHFEHSSIGLFGHVLRRLDWHAIPCVHHDPGRSRDETTPEFQALWESARGS